MEDREDHHRGTWKAGLTTRLTVTFLAAAAFLVVPFSIPAFACLDGGRGDVKCEKGDRTDGEEGDGTDKDGRPSDPTKGSTWTEHRYRKCTLDGENDDRAPGDPFCYVGDPESPNYTCQDDEAWYWVDTRLWTYSGSDWEYDERVGTNGWEPQGPTCVSLREAITEDMVIEAVNSRGLPTGGISANPPNGRTLVNFDTIFYTDQGEERFVLPLDEVNVEVDIIATPTSYDWDFGDSNTESWDTKGKPWERGVPMSEYNTYSYTDTGSFDVTLTIAYEVQYNDGSGWRTISEPITSQPSDPYPIVVLEKRNRLRDGN